MTELDMQRIKITGADDTLILPYGAMDAIGDLHGQYEGVEYDGSSLRVTIDRANVLYIGQWDHTSVMRAVQDWAASTKYKWKAISLEGIGDCVVAWMRRRVRRPKMPSLN